MSRTSHSEMQNVFVFVGGIYVCVILGVGFGSCVWCVCVWMVCLIHFLLLVHAELAGTHVDEKEESTAVKE